MFAAQKYIMQNQTRRSELFAECLDILCRQQNAVEQGNITKLQYYLRVEKEITAALQALQRVICRGQTDFGMDTACTHYQQGDMQLMQHIAEQRKKIQRTACQRRRQLAKRISALRVPRHARRVYGTPSHSFVNIWS